MVLLFLQAFLGPFSEDMRFVNQKISIKENLAIMNKWVSSDWRKIMNHTLRFKDDIAKNSKFQDLTNAINKFGITIHHRRSFKPMYNILLDKKK